MTNLKQTDDLAFPLGSLLLVTGATGYIGANVVQEALDAGFKVRGTVRSQEKVQKTKEMFQNHSNYEAAIVADMARDGAFDEAVKGVDAIIHVASVTNFSPNPEEVVTPTVQAALTIMKSALKEPKVKRFVYTSSSVAASFPKPNKKFHIGTDTWNDEAYAFVNLEPPYKEESAFGVYAASKTKAEKAVWNFVKENKPQYVVNTVLPNANFGRAIGATGATGSLVIKAYHGEPPYAVPPQYMIDVIDDARIHLAAAFDESVANERIYAYDSPFNWADVLRVLSELRPQKKFVDPKPDEGQDLSTVDNARGAELLRKWWGQDGYTGLKKSVEQNIVDES